MRIKERMLDPRLLVWASIFAFATGYLAWQAVEIKLATNFRQVRKPTNRAFRDLPSSLSHSSWAEPAVSASSIDAKTAKSSILAFLALLSLSPVMKTLTASTSSDSIWALAACLFILNALIADYSSPRPEIYTRERWGCGHYVISRARGIILTVGPAVLHQCFQLMLPYLHLLYLHRDYPTTSRCLPSCWTPWSCSRCSPSYATDYR